MRESRRIDWGGTLPGADVAFAESTDSVELAGAAEKAAAAKPEALVPRMRGKLQADVRGRCKNVDWWRVRHKESPRGVDPTTAKRHSREGAWPP